MLNTNYVNVKYKNQLRDIRLRKDEKIVSIINCNNNIIISLLIYYIKW